MRWLAPGDQVRLRLFGKIYYGVVFDRRGCNLSNALCYWIDIGLPQPVKMTESQLCRRLVPKWRPQPVVRIAE